MSRQPGLTLGSTLPSPRWAFSLLFLPLIPALARADEPAVAARQLALQDCIALAEENQPAIAAAQSSYGAALAGQRGLENLRFAGLLSRDLHVRRQEAAWGVNSPSG